MQKAIKNLLKSLLLIALFGVINISCSNNDDGITGGQDILTRDTSTTTGQLIVNVVDQNGNEVSGTRVTLHATFEDLNNGIWIYDLFNNNQGDANFGFINIGNYYIYAEQQSGNFRNNSPGDVVQVRSQKITTRTVVIK